MARTAHRRRHRVRPRRTGTGTRAAPPPRPSRLYRPHAWHRDHRFGLVGVATSVLLICLVGYLGPSAATLRLDPVGSVLPPYNLQVRVSDWVSVGLLWAALAVGAVGWWLCMRAADDGWRPRLRRLAGLGVVLTSLPVLVPPMTSADVLMYAAYGRLQVTGYNPYHVPPAEIFRREYDAVIHQVERPWQDTPTVYGPVISGTQYVANLLGGVNLHDIVFWLQLFSLLPMLGIAGVALWLARGNPLLGLRVVLVLLLNPALVWAVVAQAHNEPVAVLLGMLALALLRSHPLLAGLAIGFAGGAKINMVLYGVAMLWGLRARLRRAGLVVVGAAASLALCYAAWQPGALLAASRNTGYVNAAAWAAPVYSRLLGFYSENVSKIIVNVIGLVLWAVVAAMLARVMPYRPLPGIGPDDDPDRDPTSVAVHAATVLYVSWLLTTPNSFSWYDLLAWAPLALAAASRLDTMLLWRTTWLSAAFVTGRQYDFNETVDLVGARVRDTACVIAQVLVVLAIIWWWFQSRPPRRAAPAPATSSASYVSTSDRPDARPAAGGGAGGGGPRTWALRVAGWVRAVPGRLRGRRSHGDW